MRLFCRREEVLQEKSQGANRAQSLARSDFRSYDVLDTLFPRSFVRWHRRRSPSSDSVCVYVVCTALFIHSVAMFCYGCCYKL